MTMIPDNSINYDTSIRQSAYFPRRYLTDFFKFIKEHHKEVEVITYRDLFWTDDDYHTNYLKEFRKWKEAFGNGLLDKRKAYILIQYDVDAHPHRTMELLRATEHQGIPANIMIFNRRIDRQILNNQGILQYTEYPIDDVLLKELESRGFVIGYHTNAVEQALFDMHNALEIFRKDISDLSRNYRINYFSPHGGVVGPGGVKNRHLDLTEDLKKQVKWVHNGHTVRFKGSFSDGGHNSIKIHPKHRDFRDFIMSVRPGNRYRLVIHPQYYSENPFPSKSYSGTKWYDELLLKAETSPNLSLWDNVKLAWSNI